MTWTQTHSGRAFDLLRPRVADVSIDDIAYHLGHTRRFNGATEYSNAQHSILVASLVLQTIRSRRGAVHGLVHDGHETYTGDISSPIRSALAEMLGPFFKQAMAQLTSNIDITIWEALGLYEPVPDGALLKTVADADRRALFIERGMFLASPPKPWPGETTSFEETYARAVGSANVDWNRQILSADDATVAFKLAYVMLREHREPALSVSAPIHVGAFLETALRDPFVQEPRCTGEHDDGIADGNLTNCSKSSGCGLPGCPYRT